MGMVGCQDGGVNIIRGWDYVTGALPQWGEGEVEMTNVVSTAWL